MFYSVDTENIILFLSADFGSSKDIIRQVRGECRTERVVDGAPAYHYSQIGEGGYTYTCSG